MTRGDSDLATSVAVLGGGVLGVGWAIVFAKAGLAVKVYEQDEARRGNILADLRLRLDDLAAHGLLSAPVDEIAAQVAVDPSLESAVRHVGHVQEAVSEDLEIKRELYGRLDSLVVPTVPIASSTSAMTASMIAGGIESRSRCLVAHPGNPPYLLPIVELAPSPNTDPEVVRRVQQLMEACRMVPVAINTEVEGLVFNRLQGAILREAYSLVADGVISSADLDRVVTNGPGRRWASIGPFMTANLNVRGGLVAHAARMGPAYLRMGEERGQHSEWTEDLVGMAAASLHERFPLERWEDQTRMRDLALMRIAAALEDHG